uniref:Protein wntless n=1 Tax=Schistosoma haematobium TaxID=6185 RepID=A0A094ZMG2_SCHHA
MAGVVLETLNVRKLASFGCLMLAVQICFFLIGGLIAPAPNTTDQILMSKCIDRSGDVLKWHFARPISNESCQELLPDGDIEEVVPSDVDANAIVFIAQFPHPRDGMDLHMTRWFQQVIGVLMLDIKQKYSKELENTEITFDLRLGYRNHDDPKHVWHELARSVEVRPLKCTLDREAKRHQGHAHALDEGFYYDCEVLPLFTLASCHHEEYLLNLRIPVDEKRKINVGVGSIQDVWMVEIHQNGGFTKVWFSLKTFSFPIVLLALIFFGHRVRELERPPNILEKTIFILGICLSILNCPVEWLSLIIWSHPIAAKMGLTSIVIGALCAFAYMIYLTILVVKAFIQILGKRRLLNNLPVEQRRYYSGIIYRFMVLLTYTIICAGLTVAFFIFSQVTEDQWKWGEKSVEYTSAFITGVYGMWNVYVVAVLCLYSPSHKFRSVTGQQLYNRLLIKNSVTTTILPDTTTSNTTASTVATIHDTFLGHEFNMFDKQSETIQLVPKQSIDYKENLTSTSTSLSNVETKSYLLTEGLKFIRKEAFE